MKKIIAILFILGLITPVVLNAKKANSYWYFFAKTENSVFDDGNLSVEYKIETLNVYDVQGPYPTLKILLKNKTNETLYIDLSRCQIIKNGQANSLNDGHGRVMTSVEASALKGEKLGDSRYEIECDVNFPAKIIELAPKSFITLENIMILTASALPYFKNFYHFFSPLDKRYRYVVAHLIDKFESGDFIHYEEVDSPIKLGIDLVYSFDKDCAEIEKMSAMYYANKLVGSHFPMGFVGCPFVSNKEYEIVSRVVPGWETSDELVIHIWGYK